MYALQESTETSIQRLTETYKQERNYFISVYIGRYGLSEHEAEDLLQTTFLKALENIDKFRYGSDMKTWLFSISYHAFIDLCRRNRKKRHSNIDDIVIGDAQVIRDGHVDIEVRAYLNEVLEAVQELPHDHREALYGHAIGVRSIDSSRQQEVNPVTMRSRINRARAQLRKKLEWLIK